MRLFVILVLFIFSTAIRAASTQSFLSGIYEESFAGVWSQDRKPGILSSAKPNEYLGYLRNTDLDEADLILLADQHGDPATNRLFYRFINQFAKKGDVVLYEGPAPSSKFRCDGFSLNLLLPTQELRKEFGPYSQKRGGQHFSKIWSDLTCLSWDADRETFFRYHRQEPSGSSPSEIWGSIFEGIEVRNNFLIQNIEIHQHPGRKIFVILGSAHIPGIIPDEYRDEPGLKEVKEKAVAPLQAFLNTQKHMIVFSAGISPLPMNE